MRMPLKTESIRSPTALQSLGNGCSKVGTETGFQEVIRSVRTVYVGLGYLVRVSEIKFETIEAWEPFRNPIDQFGRFTAVSLLNF